MKNSAEVICKCKASKFWVTEGEVTKQECPQCGRKYKGVYNPDTLTIDAVVHRKKKQGVFEMKTRITRKIFGSNRQRKYVVSIITAARKLWRLGRCNHHNQTEALCFDNTYEMVFCKTCGRILSLTGETQRKDNPDYATDRLNPVELAEAKANKRIRRANPV